MSVWRGPSGEAARPKRCTRWGPRWKASGSSNENGADRRGHWTTFAARTSSSSSSAARSIALSLVHQGRGLAELGELDEALACFRRVREGFEGPAAEGGHAPVDEGELLLGEGGVLLRAERRREAATVLEQALLRFQETGRPFEEARALEALAEAEDAPEARSERLRAALALFERLHHEKAAGRVREKLAGPRED
ncbi:hypothetical protein [Allosalinactinospora lopnorensis]|uniref:hypothetical protein n=1 Tax=Allosalinactinospora lopnorensis TaxID=1352348 RepID=UPI000623F35C|nr:hypothetical protein [Allosalinactinospora lopnorensis]